MNRLLFLLPVLFMACGTQPKTTNGTLQAAEEELVAERQIEEELAEVLAAERQIEEELAAERQAETEIALVAIGTQNSGGLEQESYEEIFKEVKAFIENLNTVIKNKNFSKWRDTLTVERLKEISSPEFLTRMSQTPSMKSMKRVLKGPEDYFLYVVVPSRANSQVDKIEIIDNNKVRAIFMNTRKETTELLYELVKDGNLWKIIR
jgi:hypothetical protein